MLNLTCKCTLLRQETLRNTECNTFHLIGMRIAHTCAGASPIVQLVMHGSAKSLHCSLCSNRFNRLGETWRRHHRHQLPGRKRTSTFIVHYKPFHNIHFLPSVQHKILRAVRSFWRFSCAFIDLACIYRKPARNVPSEFYRHCNHSL